MNDTIDNNMMKNCIKDNFVLYTNNYTGSKKYKNIFSILYNR